MAGKRYIEGGEDEATEKRPRKHNLGLASVVERVVMVNNMQIIAAAIEPVLRRVVREEIEEGLRRRSIKLTKSPSLRLHNSSSSSLRLAFSTTLSSPIFTETKISTSDGTPLNILLLDSSSNPTALPFRIKLEVLVLDGDFNNPDDTSWTTEEFKRKIVKERAGKRPLLAGELSLAMRDGVAPVGALEFTDNSSWIRSRRFRIGVRVTPGTNSGGFTISEGITHAFVVKDHRGERKYNSSFIFLNYL
uniref:Calmodulin binding protein-like N-terminal domain-containing protein n=1 Tax=Kalanchoe fedtschenkoi TaxID=63787 RepID=A0A7N0V964_KALFE